MSGRWHTLHLMVRSCPSHSMLSHTSAGGGGIGTTGTLGRPSGAVSNNTMSDVHFFFTNLLAHILHKKGHHVTKGKVCCGVIGTICANMCISKATTTRNRSHRPWILTHRSLKGLDGVHLISITSLISTLSPSASAILHSSPLEEIYYMSRSGIEKHASAHEDRLCIDSICHLTQFQQPALVVKTSLNPASTVHRLYLPPLTLHHPHGLYLTNLTVHQLASLLHHSGRTRHNASPLCIALRLSLPPTH